MSPTPQSLTQPFSGTVRPSPFTVCKRKVELGCERKSGSQRAGERVCLIDERRYCAWIAPHCSGCSSHCFFSAKLAEVLAVTAQSSAWAVKSAGQVQQMLLCFDWSSRQKCDKTAHVLTQEVYHGVGISMFHHDCSLGCAGRSNCLLLLPFLPCLSLQSCK